jgi:hypothetical protein
MHASKRLIVKTKNAKTEVWPRIYFREPREIERSSHGKPFAKKIGVQTKYVPAHDLMVLYLIPGSSGASYPRLV